DVGLIGKTQPLPGIAAIGAAVGALGAADIDYIGVFGMDRNRVDIGVFRHTVGQMLPLVVARSLAEDAAGRSFHRSRRTGINVSTRHNSPPSPGLPQRSYPSI